MLSKPLIVVCEYRANRDRTDIIRQILDIANGTEDSIKTKLMYGAFISYNQLKEYLALLTEKDLLRYDSINIRSLKKVLDFPIMQ